MTEGANVGGLGGLADTTSTVLAVFSTRAGEPSSAAGSAVAATSEPATRKSVARRMMCVPRLVLFSSERV